MLRFDRTARLAHSLSLGSRHLRRNFSDQFLTVEPIRRGLRWTDLKDAIKIVEAPKSVYIYENRNNVRVGLVRFGDYVEIEEVRLQLSERWPATTFKHQEVPDAQDVTLIDTKRLLVSNLPVGYLWQDLKDHMRLCGAEVRAISVREDIGPNTAVCVFSSELDASKALYYLHGTIFGRHYLHLSPEYNQTSDVPLSELAEVKGRTVYVNNLSPDFTWQDLKDHFQALGPISFANVVRRADGSSQRYGFVSFESPVDAQKALSLHGVVLRGHPLEVRIAIDRPTEAEQAEEGRRLQQEQQRQQEAGSRGLREVRHRTVLVSGLGPTTTYDDLRKHFGALFVVEGALIRENKVTGQCLGSAKVVLKSTEAVRAAVEAFDGSTLGGRVIGVRPREARESAEEEQLARRLLMQDDAEQREMRVPPSSSGSGLSAQEQQQQQWRESFTTKQKLTLATARTVVVFGLPDSVTWQALKDHCKVVGEVEFVGLKLEAATGRTKGRAKVVFATPEQAAAAVRVLDSTLLEGQTISVKAKTSRRERQPQGGEVVAVASLREDTTLVKRMSSHSVTITQRCVTVEEIDSVLSGSEPAKATDSTTNASPAAAHGSSESLRLVVSGLPVDTTVDELRSHFATTLGAESVVFATHALSGREKRFTGRARVTVGSVEAAQAAVAVLDGSRLRGSVISVRLGAAAARLVTAGPEAVRGLKIEVAEAVSVASESTESLPGEPSVSASVTDPQVVGESQVVDSAELLAASQYVSTEEIRKRQILVWNLPLGTKWTALKDLCKSLYPDRGRDSGLVYAYVASLPSDSPATTAKGKLEFETAEQASAAAALFASGVQLGDKQVFARLRRSPATPVIAAVSRGSESDPETVVAERSRELSQPEVVEEDVEITASDREAALMALREPADDRDRLHALLAPATAHPTLSFTPEAEEERRRRQVLLSNLPAGLDWRQLKDHCKSLGDVSYVFIAPHKEDEVEKQQHHQWRQGKVEFASVEEAKRAAEALNGTEIEGQHVHARMRRSAPLVPAGERVGAWEVRKSTEAVFEQESLSSGAEESRGRSGYSGRASLGRKFAASRPGELYELTSLLERGDERDDDEEDELVDPFAVAFTPSQRRGSNGRTRASTVSVGGEDPLKFDPSGLLAGVSGKFRVVKKSAMEGSSAN